MIIKMQVHICLNQLLESEGDLRGSPMTKAMERAIVDTHMDQSGTSAKGSFSPSMEISPGSVSRESSILSMLAVFQASRYSLKELKIERLCNWNQSAEW